MDTLKPIESAEEAAIRAQVMGVGSRFEAVEVDDFAETRLNLSPPSLPRNVAQAELPRYQLPGAAEAAETLAKVIVDQYLAPALSRPTLEQYIEFWSENHEGFRSASRVLYDLREGSPSMDQERRNDLIYQYWGTEGETALRTALVELKQAVYLVGKIDPPQAQSDKERELVRVYHAAMWMCLGSTNVLAYASLLEDSELTNDQRWFMPHATQMLGKLTYDTAVEGARLRGVETDLNLDIVEQGWRGPCESMYRYLAVRAPEKLTPHIHDRALNAGLRARAVLAVGSVQETETMLSIVRTVSDSAPLIVREAALDVLGGRVENDKVKAELERLAKHADPPMLRQIAEEHLLSD